MARAQQALRLSQGLLEQKVRKEEVLYDVDSLLARLPDDLAYQEQSSIASYLSPNAPCIQGAVSLYTQVAEINHKDIVYSVAISADGTRAITGSRDNTARILERQANGTCRTAHTINHNNLVSSVAISADGSRAITGSYDRTARIVERQANGTWRTTHTINHNCWVDSVAISADGSNAISGSSDYTARIVEHQADGTWRTVHTINHNDRITSVAISAGGTRAITGSRNNTARILERQANGTWRTTHTINHNSWVDSVAISADGSNAISGYSDYTARIVERTVKHAVAFDFTAVQQAAKNLNAEQYNFIKSLYDFYQQGNRSLIVLSNTQRSVFMSLPLNLRMPLKEKYKLTIPKIKDKHEKQAKLQAIFSSAAQAITQHQKTASKPASPGTAAPAVDQKNTAENEWPDLTEEELENLLKREKNFESSPKK